MSNHAGIIVQSNPRGIKGEGVADAGFAPKPGQLVELKPNTAADANGRYTYRAPNVANDGDPITLVVVTEDHLQGKGKTDAYDAGAPFFWYIPAPGELMQILLQNQSGTADSFGVGSKVMLDDGTGLFIAVDSDARQVPFEIMEAVAGMTTDTLALARCIGH